jgi:hypothetical protein
MATQANGPYYELWQLFYGHIFYKYIFNFFIVITI